MQRLYAVMGDTMIYGNMPLLIPILATGYLLTIYLLLVLARNAKEPISSESSKFKLQNSKNAPRINPGA